MHPKYWKFPSGRRFMDAADDGTGGGSKAAGGSGNEPSDADKAAAEEAAKKAAEEAAAAAAAKDGKKPTDEEAKLLKEVMQKKEALQKTQADLAAAQERLKQFDGIDPDAIKKLLADQKAAEEAALAAKGDFDTLKARMAEEHTRVTQSLQEQIKSLQEALAAKEKTVDELSIGTQFSQSKFIAEETTIPPAKARALYGAHFDLQDGQVVGYDKPRGTAGRAPLVDQLGNPVPFEDAMRKIIEADPDKNSLLRSKVKAGAGSGSAAAAKVVTPPAGNLDGQSKIANGLKGLNLLDPGKSLAS